MITPIGRTTPPWRALVVLAASLVVACSRATPSAPTAPSSGGDVVARVATLTFRVYNSATGELPHGQFTRTATTADPIVVRLSEVVATGTDPLRAAVYEAHSGSALGAFVTSTTTGTLTIARPPRDAAYDLFLMSTEDGASYTCLDAGWHPSGGWTRRYTTLRLATAGEQVLGQPTTDFSDESFRFFAGEFSAALSPYGLQYGRVEFVGRAVAEMTAAWGTAAAAAPQEHALLLSAPGQFVADIRVRDFTSWRAFQPHPWIPYQHIAGSVVVHGLAHAYLSAPDYWDSGTACTDGSGDLACLLVACPGRDPVFTAPTPPLTAGGKDALRYWALMNGSLK